MPELCSVIGNERQVAGKLSYRSSEVTSESNNAERQARCCANQQNEYVAVISCANLLQFSPCPGAL